MRNRASAESKARVMQADPISLVFWLESLLRADATSNLEREPLMTWADESLAMLVELYLRDIGATVRA